KLSKIAKDLWELCLRRKLHLKAEHIPRIQNEMADKASRILLDRHDWMLNRDIFKILDRIWGPHHIDLFANQTNTQTHRYYSWRLDPFAEKPDAFLQCWSKIRFWMNPPWVLILSKVFW